MNRRLKLFAGSGSKDISVCPKTSSGSGRNDINYFVEVSSVMRGSVLDISCVLVTYLCLAKMMLRLHERIQSVRMR